MSGRRGARRSGPSAAGPPPESQGAGAPAPPEVTIHLTQPGAGTGPVAPGLAAADAPSIHPTAIIEPGVTIGARTAIREGVHVCGPSVIGRDCVLGEQTYVAHDVTIGDGVKTNGHIYVCTAVMIEDLVMISVGVIFSNERYPRAFDEYRRLAPSGPPPPTPRIVVRTGATIGAGALIGPGIEIGAYAMVGMGAVATRDVLPHALVVGSPARVAGWVCVCGTPLGGVAVAPPAQCARCGRRYAVTYGARGRVLSPL